MVVFGSAQADLISGVNIIFCQSATTVAFNTQGLVAQGTFINLNRSDYFMDSVTFMKNIFDGYCRCYRTLNWHSSASYSDMTQNELTYFSNLGNQLGYCSRREINRCDLSWHQFASGKNVSSKQVLYMERENNSNRALHEATKKLIQNHHGAEYLVGVFGWVTIGDLQNILNVLKKCPIENTRCILIISFVGPTQDSATHVVGILTTSQGILCREAVAEMDKGGYWYIYFPDNSDWKEGEPTLA